MEGVVAGEAEQRIVAAAPEHHIRDQRVVKADVSVVELGQAELLDRDEDVARAISRRLRRILPC